ncbi:MAG TPA: hypothetical protein VES20_03750, partial [Bryobacteraceae bacterium]|nr:hypothetical protein [Bryobacteraceae bacterium]
MITPDKYSAASVRELLEAAARGKAAVDRRWLQAILERGEQAVPEIVEFGTRQDDDDPIDISWEIVCILYQLASPAGVPWLIDYLRVEPDVPDHFIGALRRVRQHALEPLLELYAGMEEDEAGEVAFCLAALGVRDPRILGLLEDRLEYDLSEGAVALGLYGDPAARPALERAMQDEQDQHLRRLLEDAVAELGEPMSDAEHAVDLSEFFPEKALPQTEVLEDDDLVEMLVSSDPDYRLAAADACIKSDMSDALEHAVLRTAREDNDDRVRARCWEALGSAAADNEKIYNALFSKLKDTAAPDVERAGALAGLGQLAAQDDIRPFVEQFYGNAATRAAAMSAMWNSLDRSYATYFPQHLEDPDPDVRKQAISGVGYLGITDAADKLRTFFEDDEVRPNALFAYALSVRAEVSPARVRALLRKIDDTAKGLTEDEEELVKTALDE